MVSGLNQLPPHRRLIEHLEIALDGLSAACEADGYLPHHAQRTIRQMMEDLEDLLARLAHEMPRWLGPLRDDELGADTEADRVP